MQHDADTHLLDRVQELSWALLDEHITDDEMALLDNLLLSDEKARGAYVECVQLHTDLAAHFAAPPTAGDSPAPAKSPVLGFLNAGIPPIGVPAAEEIAE